MNQREFTMLSSGRCRSTPTTSVHREYIETTMDSARRRRRTASTSSTGTTRSPASAVAAAHEPRRAPAARQRLPRRDVARRAPPVHRVRDGVLRAASLRALPRPAGDHRALAGHGACADRRSARRSISTSRTRAAGRSASTSRCSCGRPLQLVRRDRTALMPTPTRARRASSCAAPVRVAVVGLGYWGPNLVRNLHELPEAEVVAVCDMSEQALDTIARRYPASAGRRSVEAILADRRSRRS